MKNVSTVHSSKLGTPQLLLGTVEVAKAWIICCYSWPVSLAVSRGLDLYLLSMYLRTRQ